MPNDHDEAKFTSLACHGDIEAFGDLYDRYRDAIFRYVFYRVSNFQDAEDLTEQIFLKTWDGMSNYREEVPFKSWIYRIAHNAIIDHYRTRKNDLPLQEYAVIPSDQPGLEKQAIDDERVNQLASTLRRLSPTHQHVLILRFIMGLGTAEVAEILEKTEGAVRVLQHRALKEAHALMTAWEVTNA